MRWYLGSIPEAVAHAQAKQSIFCVCIFGTDIDSTALQSSLESEDVQAIVIQEDVVTIRIGADSEEYRQFGAIYTNVTSPSIFCITTGGVPVEIIRGALESAELKSRFEIAVNRHREAIRLNSLASNPSSSSTASAVVSTSDSSINTSTTTNEPTTPVTAVSLSDAPASVLPQLPPIEERIERAKRLASAKQKLKREEEATEAKRLEAERREGGKKVLNLKRWQEEEETKRVAEERRKDKKEDAALLQRLREQIAQDRIDREARAEKPSTSATVETATNPELSTSASVRSSTAVNYTGLARLQFRLPDGSSHAHAFEPDLTLGTLREYLVNNISVPPQGFTIWVAFPRREFTPAEYGTSLRDLGLLPSATLLIIPGQDTRILPRVGAGTSGLLSMLSVVLLVLLSPFTYIWSLIRPRGGESRSGTALGKDPAPKSETGGSPPTRIPNRGGNVLGGTSGNSGQEEALRKRKSGNSPPTDTKSSTGGKKGGESFGRQEGNVHRLRNTETDSDDEQGTYNGNSTQQM